ncbi:uncharacterized protein LOC126871859 [Bombus huntii]|uniref:uncharacterized protein LOC126871859 n=1 Tax=Bombus huntii TaxID=85661 RepID=UPI0021AA7FC9|nr:uncharacterized protein LOC126871859 [Bombus huntii]XP_050487105.1 uncharacterized protein LOC126871859 [Bombus huntii]XP_050487106.1 uncharacterized protein LOC126871859 [Bombus huntii]
MNDMEVYITCPYNKCHRIRKSRFQIHITKCAKNYQKDDKLACKYDRTHILDSEQYEHHLTICPSSGDVKSKEITLESDEDVPRILVERVPNTRTRTMDEDWTGNNRSYNPLAATENRDVIRGAIAMSKSQKKQFKQYERERMSLLQRTNSDSSSNTSSNTSTARKKVDIEQPLQPPKQLSKAMLCDGNFASNLISKLDKLKIEESDGKKGTKSISSKKEDVSIISNNSSNIADSTKNCLKNNTIDTSTDIGITSSTINNSFSQKGKENIPNEENNAVALFKDIFEADKGVSDVGSDLNINVISQGNNPEAQGNDKKDNIKKNNSQPKSSKQGSSNSQNIIPCNTKIAAKLYGEAKKISTGRGFTRIYQHLNSNMKMEKEGEGKKMTQDLVSDYGYDKE